jgi:hypothetical protein
MVLEHRNYTPWYKLAIPHYFHRCHAQSWGDHIDRDYATGCKRLVHIERCACGAIRMGEEKRWYNRNTRMTRERRLQIKVCMVIVCTYALVAVIFAIEQITGNG